jgi:hypothetical protein
MTDKTEMDPTKMLAQGLLGFLIAGMENQELRVTIKELEDRQKEVEGMELDLELNGSDLRLFYKPQESK